MSFEKIALYLHQKSIKNKIMVRLKDLKEKFYLIKTQYKKYNIYSLTKPSRRTNYLFVGTVEIAGRGKIRHIQTDMTASSLEDVERITDKWLDTIEYSPECYDPTYAHGYRELYMMLDYFDKYGFVHTGRSDRYELKISNFYKEMKVSLSLDIDHDKKREKMMRVFVYVNEDSFITIEENTVDELITSINAFVRAIQLDIIANSLTIYSSMSDKEFNMDCIKDTQLSTVKRVFDLSNKPLKDVLIEKLEKSLETLKSL